MYIQRDSKAGFHSAAVHVGDTQDMELTDGATTQPRLNNNFPGYDTGITASDSTLLQQPSSLFAEAQPLLMTGVWTVNIMTLV